MWTRSGQIFLLATAVLALVFPRFCYAATEPAKVFIHEVSTPSPTTEIDHPSLNGKRNHRVLVTQFYDGGGNPNPSGVFYNSATARWTIYNENGVNIPAGATFNVRVTAPTSRRTIRFTASGKNSVETGSIISLGAKKPDAILLATHFRNLTPTVDAGVHFPYPIGFRYGAGPKWDRWLLQNTAEAPAVATSFNVFDATDDGNSLIVTAPGGSYDLVVNHPQLDGNPDAVLFVGHNSTGVASNALLAVDYVGTTWRIYDQTFAVIPAGVRFNVKFYPAVAP